MNTKVKPTKIERIATIFANAINTRCLTIRESISMIRACGVSDEDVKRIISYLLRFGYVKFQNGTVLATIKNRLRARENELVLMRDEIDLELANNAEREVKNEKEILQVLNTAKTNKL